MLIIVFLLGVMETKAQDTLRTSTGIKYVVLEEGRGLKPVTGDKLSVYFKGTLSDGKKFDSNDEAYDPPIKFKLGAGKVIKGWEEVLINIPQGTKVKAWIPAEKAYGKEGYPHPEIEGDYLIPPNAVLIFELYLKKVKH